MAASLMPGGYLSFGIYQKLGGERDFAAFWLQLGLPTVLFLAACYLLVAQRIVTLKAWMIGSATVVTTMAMGVSARVIH